MAGIGCWPVGLSRYTILVGQLGSRCFATLKASPHKATHWSAWMGLPFSRSAGQQSRKSTICFLSLSLASCAITACPPKGEKFQTVLWKRPVVLGDYYLLLLLIKFIKWFPSTKRKKANDRASFVRTWNPSEKERKFSLLTLLYST